MHSDHVHWGYHNPAREASIDFTLDENTMRNLKHAFRGYQPDIKFHKHEPTEYQFNNVKIGPGHVYIAPLDETPDWELGWKHLGYTTEDGIGITAKPTTTNALLAHLGHKSIDTTYTDKDVIAMLGSNATADQLEKAALNLAAQAQAIREFDATEPQGDEPTISFRHSYPHSYNADGSVKEYTFVAVKAGDDKWYLTGRATRGYSWRELGAEYRAVAEGRFWVATGWAWQGPAE
jgi:hypothetical protein